MEYLYLVLSLTSSFIIALMLRFFEKKGQNRTVIIGSNYILAGSLSYFLSQKTTLSPIIIGYGFILGLFFFLSFWVFSQGIKSKGLASTITIGRLSLAVPVLLSILFWGEKPTITNIISLLLILVIILAWENKIGSVSPLLLYIFILFGLLDAAMKYFKLRFPAVDNGFFLIIVFFSAMLWSWAYIFFSRQSIKAFDIGCGLLIGVPNFCSSYFMLKTLAVIPAYIAFPFINIGMIVLSALVGAFFFKEWLGKKKIALLCLAIVAVWFLTS